jgi:hypothetical protein
MENIVEFRKVTKTKDGDQLIRIPKPFAMKLSIDGGTVKMFCSRERLIIERV